MEATQLVWFKRDLRVADHEPLVAAAARGPVVGLYVWEPIVFGAAEFDAQHATFLLESLAELRERLRALGSELLIRRGDAVSVLSDLHAQLGFSDLWAHEETGLLATYERDRAVAAWARARGVAFHERPQTGVVRRLKSRDGWSRVWTQRMSAPALPAPTELRSTGLTGVDRGDLPDLAALDLRPRPMIDVQRGGELAARATLDDFLFRRGRSYRSAMSAPGPGWEGCSRLSAYLAFGNLSMRTVYQATEARILAIRLGPKSAELREWLGSLNAFAQRLRWHCHFMQKLEDQPSLENTNTARVYDGLREAHFDEARFEAWRKGQTGFPMVDACMRSLEATGWLNFRMRAMLVSFASYDLWLHWTRPAQWLGSRFLDFEPGIHYAQYQMQSGVTGINTLRMYSPTKQARDHDPQGTFIRRWVPELAAVPDEYIAEPASMPPLIAQACGVRIGIDYPAPIVDHTAATAEARRRISAVRRTDIARAEAREVLAKHGSRRRPAARKAG